MLCSTVVLIMPHYESKSMPSQHESLFGNRQITKSISVSVSILICPLTGRLIQISRDGKITDDEIHDFALISKKLDEISLAIDSLNLWVDKTASDHKINIDLLNEEKRKLQVSKYFNMLEMPSMQKLKRGIG